MDLKHECGVGRCCICKTEAVNRNVDALVADENTSQNKLFLCNYYHPRHQSMQRHSLHIVLCNANLYCYFNSVNTTRFKFHIKVIESNMAPRFFANAHIDFIVQQHFDFVCPINHA